MADYLVLYSDVTGHVLGMWPRASSDNSATFLADGKITVDGVDVATGLCDGTTDGGDLFSQLAAAVLSDPTFTDTEAPHMVAEVDSTTTPTDATEIGAADPSGRNPEYEFAT